MAVSPPPTDSDADISERQPGRQNEYEEERVPREDGAPPRPAQEPEGAEGSSNSGQTAVDPATGRPNP